MKSIFTLLLLLLPFYVNADERILSFHSDIRVMNEYGVVSRGRDQQLEAAVAELFRLVGGN